MNTEYIIRAGPRIERLELPEEALREGLLNAFAHRNYFVSGASILVEIYSDRVEITNPGGLVKGLTLEDLGKRSLSRNNLLFGLMQRMNLVEKVGSGILRMRNVMAAYGLEGPAFNIDENWFTIVFKRAMKREAVRWYKKWYERWYKHGLAARDIEIIRAVCDNPKTSIRGLAGVLKINPSAVQKHIVKLKEKGILDREGPAKGGCWIIRESGEK